MGKRILYFFIIFAAACLLLGCDGPEDGLTGQAEPTVTGIQEIQTQTSKTSNGAEHNTGESLHTQDLEVHFLEQYLHRAENYLWANLLFVCRGCRI